MSLSSNEAAREELQALVATGQLPTNTISVLKESYTRHVRDFPHEDSFYTVTSPSSVTALPGTILKVEGTCDPNLYALPPGVAISRLIYQSRSLIGRLVPASACLLWPLYPRRSPSESDKIPLVAWAHGSSGISASNAPSGMSDLSCGFNGLFNLVEAGYAVLAPDYAGLGVSQDANGEAIVHEYLANPAHANDIVFGVQAAKAAFPELSRRFVVIGISQGGGAAWGVAQRQEFEPMDGYLGAVAVAPVTDVLNEAESEVKDPSFLNEIAYMVPGLVQNSASFTYEEILTPEAIERMSLWQRLGGGMALGDVLFEGLKLVKDDWQSNIALRQYVEKTANGRRPIAEPLLVIQGKEDACINIDVTEDAVRETREMFPDADLKFVEVQRMGHDGVLLASLPLWMRWIDDAFEGQGANANENVKRMSKARVRRDRGL